MEQPIPSKSQPTISMVIPSCLLHRLLSRPLLCLERRRIFKAPLVMRKWRSPGPRPLARVERPLTITPHITAPMVQIIQPLVPHFLARVAL